MLGQNVKGELQNDSGIRSEQVVSDLLSSAHNKYSPTLEKGREALVACPPSPSADYGPRSAQLSCPHPKVPGCPSVRLPVLALGRQCLPKLGLDFP